jgi:hypothetical protein
MVTMKNKSLFHFLFPTSDIFLWNPVFEIKLAGVRDEDMGDTEHGGNPFFVSVYQDMRRGRVISKNRLKEIWSIWVKNFPSLDLWKLRHNGQWEWFFYGMTIKEGRDIRDVNFSSISLRIIELERALKKPTKVFLKNKMTLCAELLETSPVLSGYLWPEAIETIRMAESKDAKEVVFVRLMVMLEIFLSCLANLDCQIQIDLMPHEFFVDKIFPDFSSEKKVFPIVLFFDWIGDYSGRKICFDDIPIVNQCTKDGDVLCSQNREWYRWKSGDKFPSDEKMKGLFRSLFGNAAENVDHPRHKDWRLSWTMLEITKRINVLSKILFLLSIKKNVIWPFWYKSAQKWRESRYEYWRNFWKEFLGANKC